MSKTLTREDATRMKAERQARRAQLAPEEPAPSSPVSETVSHVDDDPWQPPDDAPGSDGDHQKRAPVAALRKRWGRYGKQDWSRSPPPPRRWLLTRPLDPGEVAISGSPPAGYLPRGKVGMIAGAGGAGKTTALLQLAVSVASGSPWLGAHGFDVPQEEAGYVCILLAEEDEEEVQRRMIAIKTTLCIEEKHWSLVRERLWLLPMVGASAQLIEPAEERGKTRETPFFDDFRKLLDGEGVDWSLIILDPLSRLATAETEVDNHHATKFVEAIEKLVAVRGNPAVLVAHHTNKSARSGLGAGSSNAARGASGLTDGVRWLATLDYPTPEKGEEAQLTLSLAKHNYSPPAAPRGLVRGAGGVLSVKAPDKAEGQAAASTPASKASEKPSKKNGKPSKPEETEDDPNAPF